MQNGIPTDFSELPKGRPKKKKPIILVIVFLALVAAGFFGWKIYENSRWQNYANAKYGYSMKYPKAWIFDSGSPEEISVSNYRMDSLSRSGPENMPANLTTMAINIRKVSATTTVEQFIINSIGLVPKTTLSDKEINIGGVPGRQIVYAVPGGGKEILYAQTFLKQDDKVIVLTWNSFKPESGFSGDIPPLYGKMLKSLKFGREKI